MQKREKIAFNSNHKYAQSETLRLADQLKEVITLYDEKGRVVYKTINPLHVEFTTNDLLQVIVGSSILAIPVGFTEETWNLGKTLPMLNIILLLLISLLFITTFVYYTSYKRHIEQHFHSYLKRVISTYLFSFVVVAILLSVIQRTPWLTEPLLALKRIIIVTFPASMSAAIADTLK